MANQVGIATGAARGMGWACAQRLVESNDVVFLLDLNEAGVAEAAEQLSGKRARLVPLAIDVTDPAAIADLVVRIESEGQLRAVAHAAGISPTMADWRRIFTVDLVGSAMLIDAFEPLVRPGTAMVCFASMASQILAANGDQRADALLDTPTNLDLLDQFEDVLPGVTDPGVAYGWAKRGVQRLVRRKAIDWGPLGGRLVSVSPGMIDTPQGQQEFDQQPMMQVLLDMTPVGRLGEADDVANLVEFLLSDKASFISGTDILIDGAVVAALHAQGGF